MRRMGRTWYEWYDHRLMNKPAWVFWTIYQFAATIALIAIMTWPVWAEIGTLETQWTDFSPEVEEVTDIPVRPAGFIETYQVQSKESVELDKEKYRVYFEDKQLVLMVLGGLEYWKLNCGTLSGTGDYFMKLAIKKHGIDEEEMDMNASFQMGLFAATLYNDCDIFLEQTKSIGLDMMLKKMPQPELETVDNLSDSEA